MSLYYKQDFVDAEPFWAEVRERLSSYFNAGVVDDIMFPIWTDHCLKRFKKASFPIYEAVLTIDGYEACVPDDFNSVRELWACSVHFSDPIQSPSACYYQEDCRIDPQLDACGECFEPDDSCTTRFMVTHKVTNKVVFSFTRSHLLRPGNMNAKNCCGDSCGNLYSQSYDTFDIINGKIITNVPEGSLHLVYYANTNGKSTMVPDNFWVQDYIRKYLVYMCFQQMSDRITDETFNQIQTKLIQAKQDSATAFILAETELKKQTAQEKVRQIQYSYNRFNRAYRIP